jgi:hypothetical protein
VPERIAMLRSGISRMPDFLTGSPRPPADRTGETYTTGALVNGQARRPARAGDEAAFAALVERHRGELRVHCHRMLGSYDETEDLVRAWKSRPRFWRAALSGGHRTGVNGWK